MTERGYAPAAPGLEIRERPVERLQVRDQRGLAVPAAQDPVIGAVPVDVAERGLEAFAMFEERLVTRRFRSLQGIELATHPRAIGASLSRDRFCRHGKRRCWTDLGRR